MQKVVWGKKKRHLAVPEGWAFVKDGEFVYDSDMFFNMGYHCWSPLTDVGGAVTAGVRAMTGPDEAFEVVIRKADTALVSSLDNDPDAVRVVDCL